jgi:hypothetical protein
MGNGPAHDFVYEPLVRVPGLLVLHDLVLHHARGRMFLEAPEARAYARDPGARPRARPRRSCDRYRPRWPTRTRRRPAPRRGAPRHRGRSPPYAYPLFRLPVEASRAVAVHNAFMAERSRGSPGRKSSAYPCRCAAARGGGAAEALAERYAIGADDFVVGTFGLVTREKRVDTVARRGGAGRGLHPGVRLLVVGPVADRGALDARLARPRASRPRDRHRPRALPELAAHIELADAVAHLRYPTARETSAALLRVLAQGRPRSWATSSTRPTCRADAVLRADVAGRQRASTTRANPEAGCRRRPCARGWARRARAFRGARHARSARREAYARAIELAATRRGPPSRAGPRTGPRSPAPDRPRPTDGADLEHRLNANSFRNEFRDPRGWPRGALAGRVSLEDNSLYSN